jgi:hypothetical protein
MEWSGHVHATRPNPSGDPIRELHASQLRSSPSQILLFSSRIPSRLRRMRPRQTHGRHRAASHVGIGSAFSKLGSGGGSRALSCISRPTEPSDYEEGVDDLRTRARLRQVSGFRIRVVPHQPHHPRRSWDPRFVRSQDSDWLSTGLTRLVRASAPGLMSKSGPEGRLAPRAVIQVGGLPGFPARPRVVARAAQGKGTAQQDRKEGLCGS